MQQYRDTNKQTNFVFLLSATSVMPLVLYNWIHIWIEYNEHIHIYIQRNATYIHTFIQAAFSAQTLLFFVSCIHTFILVWKLLEDHLASFLPSVRLLCFMKCLLVAPQSTDGTVRPLLPFVQLIVTLHMSPAWN